MDQLLAGPIIRKVMDELEKAANEIEEISIELAKKNQEINALKDDLSLAEAKIRVNVSTAVNKDTGRPRFPNVDSQNARVLVEMSESDDYVAKKTVLLDAELERELFRAKLVRLQERRRDARTQAELMEALIT